MNIESQLAYAKEQVVEAQTYLAGAELLPEHPGREAWIMRAAGKLHKASIALGHIVHPITININNVSNPDDVVEIIKSEMKRHGVELE